MNLQNMMEDITLWIFEEHSQFLNLTCHCTRCKLDIMAIALNALPPQYIVEEDKKAYIKAKYIENQYKINVLSEIANAARIVTDNPHHG